MNGLLLDTDTISLFLRNQPKVMLEANNYLKFHKGFTFSIITRFEILRGLKAKTPRVKSPSLKGFVGIVKSTN